MYPVRRWAVRHASGLARCYRVFEKVLVVLHPLFQRVGYQRLDKPVAAVEKVVKGVLFDSQMCGLCTLSATGMSCPMNCPKHMRNGPCGGVRANGNCEVKEDMRCVWVEAWEGSQRMQGVEEIRLVQEPLDHRMKGTSSWLRAVRKRVGTGKD
tara:strand:- start:434 stop:892 length:459 start_codon:yes stop_codon:yes gene_type:complete